MSYFGNNNPKSAMGELETIAPTPIVQISAQYGILSSTLPIAAAGGSFSSEDNKFICQTGANVGGLGTVLTRKQLYVKAGQGGMCVFDAMFSTPAANSQQTAGFINSEDSFSIGYYGTEFGVLYYNDGKNESLNLTITGSGSGSGTVTIDGVGYSVTLTAGTTAHNAYEIANALKGIVPNYDVKSVQSKVVMTATLPGARGTFSFTGTTSTSTFTQAVIGKEPDINFTNMASMNGVPFFDGFDPLLLNYYKITFDGNIHFYIQNQETSNFDLVHTIKHVNTTTIPHVSNPTFRGGWLVRSLGSATNLKIEGSKMGLFLQGTNVISNFIQSTVNTGDFSSTEESILSVRVRLEFKDKINRSSVYPTTISLSSDATKAMIFTIYALPVYAGETIFNYISENFSIVEYSNSKTTLSSFAKKIGTFTASLGAGAVIQFDDLSFEPTDLICITAKNVANSTASATASVTWREDL